MDIKKISSLDSNQRIDAFKKNPFDENFIELLNTNLANLEHDISSSIKEKVYYPSIIVTGMARTGSTLLTQILASRLNIGYVSNLMARFYKTPLTGVKLQKMLIGNSIHSVRNYNSTFGVTENIIEPHEFGYFWTKHLATNNHCHEFIEESELTKINFKVLNLELDKISALFEKPFLCKCTIAPFILEHLIKNTSLFVIHITREKEPTIKSVKKARKERLGSISKWWSIRPKGFENMLSESPENQLSWQFDKTVNSIKTSQQKSPNRILTCKYEKLLENPEKCIDDIISAYYEHSNFYISKVGDKVVLT